MTLCIPMATAAKNGIRVTAWERTEKCSAVPNYEITVSKIDDPHPMDEIKTARTTWKKRYKEICRQYGIEE